MKKLAPFIVAGIATKTTNENNQSYIDISKLWKRFLQEKIADKINHKVDDNIHVVYTDYEGDYTKPYRVIIGCSVSNTIQESKNLFIKNIPSLNYEIFHAHGKLPECLIQTWQTIWQSDLNRAYVADLEIYSKNFDPDHAELDVLISIK